MSLRQLWWLRKAKNRQLEREMDEIYPDRCAPKTDEQMEAEAQLMERYGDPVLAAVIREAIRKGA